MTSHREYPRYPFVWQYVVHASISRRMKLLRATSSSSLLRNQLRDFVVSIQLLLEWPEHELWVYLIRRDVEATWVDTASYCYDFSNRPLHNLGIVPCSFLQNVGMYTCSSLRIINSELRYPIVTISNLNPSSERLPPNLILLNSFGQSVTKAVVFNVLTFRWCNFLLICGCVFLLSNQNWCA